MPAATPTVSFYYGAGIPPPLLKVTTSNQQYTMPAIGQTDAL